MPDWLLLILSTGLGGSVAALAGLLLRPCLIARYTAHWQMCIRDRKTSTAPTRTQMVFTAEYSVIISFLLVQT